MTSFIPGFLNGRTYEVLKFRMILWLQNRMDVIRLTLRHPVLLGVFGILLAIRFSLALFPSSKTNIHTLEMFMGFPWYGWALVWTGLLWVASIEYSVRRKEEFDKTSLNFFKAFLDFLIKQGHHLYDCSGDEDFYSKINDWQHQVIQGIAIGLGPEESEKYFQKMDGQNPLPKAYRASRDSSSSEPLCLWLQENLAELDQIRMGLTGTKDFKEEELERIKNTKLLGEFKR